MADARRIRPAKHAGRTIAWGIAQALIAAGSIAGGLVGIVVARELAKAGKLRVEEE